MQADSTPWEIPSQLHLYVLILWILASAGSCSYFKHWSLLIYLVCFFLFLVYVLLWNVLTYYQLGECFCLWYKQWQILVVKAQQTLCKRKKGKKKTHQTLNYSRKKKLQLKKKECAPLTGRKPIFISFALLEVIFFSLIFFRQNVVNQNIYILWFPFSLAPDFLCYTKRVEALAAVALCVSRKSSGKSHAPLASVNKVCLWIPGKKKEGSRDRQ